MILDRLAELNPDSFTLEDIAYVMGWWKWVAKIVLKTAVRRGEFTLRDGIYSLPSKEQS